jgi:RNA-directed DNA polymerase
MPKASGKMRPIGIPAIIDRCLQTIVLNSLEPAFEPFADFASYGFRPGRGVNDAIAKIYRTLETKQSLWVLEADITGCFDNISHEFILNRLANYPFKNAIQKWLKGGILLEGIYFETITGTPQDGVLSALMCNIALDGLETKIGIKYRLGSSGPWGRYFTNARRAYKFQQYRALIRYADDFVVICDTYQLACDLRIVIQDFLKDRGMELSSDKTKISHVSEGFVFLGFDIRIHTLANTYYKSFEAIKDDPKIKALQPTNTFTWITPSKKSISSVKEKIKLKFIDRKLKLGDLIENVNSIIRGYTTSKNLWHVGKAFSELDFYLYTLKWAYVKRKHRNKNATWRKNQYFKTLSYFGKSSKWEILKKKNFYICFGGS